MTLLAEMLDYSFMRHALIVGVFGGGVLAFLGVLVHLRRVVFIGAALPQLLAAGIASAWLIGLHPLAGALFAGAIGLILLSSLRRSQRLGPETWIGWVFAAGGASAIVLMAASPAPDAGMLRLFTGDILGTSATDAAVVVVAAAVIALVFRLFWSRIVLSGFDPLMTATLGVRVPVWDAVFFAGVILATLAVMQTGGGLLAFSMLVGPSAAALLLFRSLGGVITAAVAGGAVAAAVGLGVSFQYDLPGGPSMALAALIPLPMALVIQALRLRIGARG